MPNFRDGTVNIAALQNPGVYIDQILPQPFINGVPTNIMGLVGVGSWGPLNAVQFFSSLDQCAGIYGIPTIRPYDLASYVMVALQEGISIGFAGVRVTDGTDTAASVSLPSKRRFVHREIYRHPRQPDHRSIPGNHAGRRLRRRRELPRSYPGALRQYHWRACYPDGHRRHGLHQRPGTIVCCSDSSRRSSRGRAGIARHIRHPDCYGWRHRICGQ
jgi:hypothetical protein